jgi:type I restriction enzyme S subunit
MSAIHTVTAPDDWEIDSWGEVCEKIQDGTHFSPTTDQSEEYKYLTSKNIRFGFLDLTNLEHIDEKQHRDVYKRCSVKQNDVLLTKDGANTGNAALNCLSEEFSLLSSVAFLRPHESRMLPEFLLQTILSEQGQRMIKDSMSGLAITRITLQIIKGFPIVFPKIP